MIQEFLVLPHRQTRSILAFLLVAPQKVQPLEVNAPLAALNIDFGILSGEIMALFALLL